MRTGAVNSAMPPHPGRARKAAPAPAHARTQNRSIARPSPEPTRQRPQASSKRKSDDKVSELAQRIGGKTSLKQIIYTTLAFFLLFVILAAFKFVNDNNRYKKAATDAFQSEMASSATNVARTLDAEIAWIDTALSLQGSPKQIINFVARGPRVVGAAIIDSAGQVVSATPGAGDPLASVDRRDFPKSGVSISSLVNDSGTVTPVITRKKGDVFLVVALRSGTLIGDQNTNRVLILDGGRVVDGQAQIAKEGILGYFQMSPAKLNYLSKQSSGETITAHSLGSDNIWLGAAKVPNSFLTVIDSLPRQLSPGLKQNIFLFGLLFAGTAWLIWRLMSLLLRQIDSVRNQHFANEASQRRVNAAMSGYNGGLWEMDLTNNNVFLSSSFAKLFGMAEKETTITLPQFLGLFVAGDRDKLYNAIRRSHVSGPFELDLGIAHLPIIIMATGKPSFNEADQAKIITGMAMDVTEAKGASMRLQAAEARLHDALGSMSDSFVIWDQMDRLVLWNAKFEDFFGFQPGQLQQGIEHSVVEYHANQAIEQIYALEDGTGNEIYLKDGRWLRYLETHTVDGGRVSIGTDVTAIRTREYQLQVNQEALERTIAVLKKSQVRIVELAENYEQEKIRAEEANQSKSEFLANMSHELRTPLNAINGFSDIMQKEMFGPLGDTRYKEYVNDILFSGQHLLSLINDILDMSKIEAGKMTLNVEPMLLNDMIKQVIRIVRGRADDNRLKLVFQETDVPEIEADPRAVKQVLLNLATNAIKFTPEGGVVRIAVEPKSAGLIIRVSDTGIGISEEDIQRLAQPFEQIDSQHSRKHEGTGLGLALSKSLVELHGGNFTIESQVGQGTTVIFTLPSRPPEQKDATPDTEVGDEISRLAQDIADVLAEGGVHTGASAQTAPAQPSPTPQAPPAPQAYQAPTSPQQGTPTPPPYIPPANSSAA